MTANDPRLSEIAAKLDDPRPQGFRAECRELIGEVRELLRVEKTLRGALGPDDAFFSADTSAESVANRCERVARQFPG